METDTPWKKPPFDLTPLSLMLFAQFGAVLSIAVWFIPDDLGELNAATVILLLGLTGIGLLQLFRVKNGRLLTYPCIALLALSWVVLGEFEVADAIFVTVFMSIIFTFLVYIPALAFDNYGMTLQRPRRKVFLLVLTVLLAAFWFGADAVTVAMEGEYEVDWDYETDEPIMEAISGMEHMLAIGAATLFSVGILGLVVVAGFGVKAGPLRPVHFGLALSASYGLFAAIMFLVDDGGVFTDLLEVASLGGMLTLPALGFFSEDESALEPPSTDSTEEPVQG